MGKTKQDLVNTAVRSETQDAIPFIGEMDRSKKQ